MDKQQKVLLGALIISFLLHAGFIVLVGFKDLLAFESKKDSSIPEEVTIVFPENKPEPDTTQIKNGI